MQDPTWAGTWEESISCPVLDLLTSFSLSQSKHPVLKCQPFGNSSLSGVLSSGLLIVGLFSKPTWPEADRSI